MWNSSSSMRTQVFAAFGCFKELKKVSEVLQTLQYQNLQQTVFPFSSGVICTWWGLPSMGLITFPTSGRLQGQCPVFWHPPGVKDLVLTNIWIYLHTFVWVGFSAFNFMMNGFCIQDLSAIRSFLLWNFSKQLISCLGPCIFSAWQCGFSVWNQLLSSLIF